MRDLLAARPPGGKPPAKCIDLVIDLRVSCDDVVQDARTPTPDELQDMVEGRHPWTLGAVKQWGELLVAWIREEILPDAPIACACIHLDEKSVHIHFEIAPIVKTTDGTIRLGNSPVREAMARRATEFEAVNSKAKILRKQEYHRKGKRFREDRFGIYVGFKKAMSLAQDAYHDKFGRRYGLERGMRGSKRLHEAIDRTKGLEAKVKAMEREETELRQRRARLHQELEGINPNGVVEAYQREKAERAKAEKTIIDLKSRLADTIKQREVAQSAPATEYMRGRSEMKKEFELFRRSRGQSAKADEGYARMYRELTVMEKIKITRASEVSMAAAYQRGRDDIRREYFTWACQNDRSPKLLQTFKNAFNLLEAAMTRETNFERGE